MEEIRNGIFAMKLRSQNVRIKMKLIALLRKIFNTAQLLMTAEEEASRFVCVLSAFAASWC